MHKQNVRYMVQSVYQHNKKLKNFLFSSFKLAFGFQSLFVNDTENTQRRI